MITRRSLGALAVGAGLPLPALAQGLSNRPIRLVIPFTPAGTTELVGRLTAERLSARLGQQVVVDNRPGASGNVGGEFVARAEPDGHTLLLTTIGTGAINFAVFGNRMPFKPEDLAAVGLMCRVPNVLMAANRMPIRTLADMVREAKAKPGALNYGTAGIATSPHVVIEQIRLQNRKAESVFPTEETEKETTVLDPVVKNSTFGVVRWRIKSAEIEHEQRETKKIREN